MMFSSVPTMRHMSTPLFQQQAYTVASASDGPLYVRLLGNPSHQPLVLLHGAWQSGEMFAHTYETLTARYYLIIPDLRGHGFSTKPLVPEAYTPLQFAQDLKALLLSLPMTLTQKVTLYSASELGQIILTSYFEQFGDAFIGNVVLSTSDPLPARILLTDLASHETTTHYLALMQYMRARFIDIGRAGGRAGAESVGSGALTEPVFWQAFASGLLVPRAASEALIGLLSHFDEQDRETWKRWPVPTSPVPLGTDTPTTATATSGCDPVFLPEFTC